MVQTALRESTKRMIADRFKVVDNDAHVIEPADLWTARVPSKYGEMIPHVRRDTRHPDQDRWWFGNKRSWAAAGFAMAGWKQYPPDHPPTLAEADPGAWDAGERIKRMDEYGIWAEVLFPNIAGFGAGTYFHLEDPELMILCLRAYNDWVSEWTSVAPERFLRMAALPIWDVNLVVEELHRCRGMGFKGALFTGNPESFGQPLLADPYWEPFWHACEDAGMPVMFHTGAGNPDVLTAVIRAGYRANGRQANYAKNTGGVGGNAEVIGELICSGICHRHPNLNFVSVESSVGWVPAFAEHLDWSWGNAGVILEHPEYDLSPSEYMRRQVLFCWWFETDAARYTISRMPECVLYETDYPHPTSMSPGPASIAQKPRDFLEEHFSALPEEALKQVLWGNAARIYQLE